MRGEIIRQLITAQFSEFPVARGSSIADQFNDMTMVDVSQTRSVLRLAGRRGIFHHDSL